MHAKFVSGEALKRRLDAQLPRRLKSHKSKCVQNSFKEPALRWLLRMLRLQLCGEQRELEPVQLLQR